MKRQGKREKGIPGYIKARKQLYIVATAIGLTVVAAFFVTGLILCKTRNNLLTVMAILMVLPTAKFAVDLIMCIACRPVSAGLYEKLEAADNKFLHKYECLFTSKEKATYVTALVITPHAVCAYTTDAKADTARFKQELEKYVKEARLSVTVSLYNDENQFIKKVKLMSDSRDAELTGEEADRMQWVWESVRCMCM